MSEELNYWDGLIQKLLNKEEFSERELNDLVNEFDEYIFEVEEGDDRRWYREVTTTLKVGDRYFQIVWDKGLTENQEWQFDNQPYEVKWAQLSEVVLVNNYTKI